MRRIVAEYEVVTPLFLGGANHVPEFRLPSFVNVVRWWWRFLALGRYGGTETAPAALRASFWEAVLFGWHEKPFGRKRATFTLLEETAGFPRPWTGIGRDWLKEWPGIRYLSAQGLDERQPVRTKAFRVAVTLADFESGKTSKCFRRAVSSFPPAAAELDSGGWQTACETLRDALALVGLAGGLGARSRRGFGSLAVRRLEEDGDSLIDGLPETPSGYAAMIRQHLGAAPADSGEPPYTAFGARTRIDLCCRGSDPRLLMNEVGWAFQIYRSWGQRKQDGTGHEHVYRAGAPLQKQIPAGRAKDGWYRPEFRDDHDKFYKGKTFPPGVFDNRALLGLPHNYGKTQVGWDVRDDQMAHGRRASPLIFHFHRLESGDGDSDDGDTVFVTLAAPAVFLPDEAKLAVNGKPRVIPKTPRWDLVSGFSEFVRHPPPGAADPSGKCVAFTGWSPLTGSIP